MKLLLLFLFTSLFAQVSDHDFDKLMGKNTRVFRFVKLKEDRENYDLLRSLFFKRHQKNSNAQNEIPKVMHFIWLGPNAYPQKSIQKLRSWMAFHKGYTFKLWTDQKRNLQVEGLEEIQVQDHHLKHLLHEYRASNNPAEKSDLLRYEILHQEGGLYLDHDILCLKRLDASFFTHEFFATLSPLATPIIYPNTIRIRNSIIGCKPKHPLFEELFKTIQERFVQITENGKDFEQTLEVVTKRTFIPFHDCLLKQVKKEDSTGIIFPVGYFTKILKQEPIYADESMEGLWWRKEKSFYEEYLEKRVNKLEARTKYLAYAIVLLFALILIKRKKSYVRTS